MRKESMLESKWKFPVSPISAELSQCGGGKGTVWTEIQLFPPVGST